MAKIHIYNIKGQKVCSREFNKNKQNHINLTFKDVNSLDLTMVCKKCAQKIGKPYFDDESLMKMYKMTD